jgi:hypothetical protein
MTNLDTDAPHLITAWQKAAEALGLEIVAPFALPLQTGEALAVPLLVKSFGAPNGMLIVRDYNQVRLRLKDIAEAGYGFSVLDEPNEHEPFILDGYKDILRDWGWSGGPDGEPSWLSPP